MGHSGYPPTVSGFPDSERIVRNEKIGPNTETV